MVKRKHKREEKGHTFQHYGQQENRMQTSTKLLLFCCCFVACLALSNDAIDLTCARLSVMAYKDAPVSYGFAKHVKRIKEDTLVADLFSDATHKLMYVAIRGTEKSMSDWLNNLNIMQEPVEFVINNETYKLGKIHMGFYKKAELLAKRIEQDVASYKGYKLIVTGHSQGILQM